MKIVIKKSFVSFILASLFLPFCARTHTPSPFSTFLTGLSLYTIGIGLSTYSFHQKTLCTFNNSLSLNSYEQSRIKYLRLAGLGLIALGSIITFNTLVPSVENYIKLFFIEGSIIGLTELIRSSVELQSTFEADPLVTHSSVALTSIILFKSFKALLSSQVLV